MVTTMTISVPVREFKSKLSHYLTKAQGGETIEITSHRKAIARVRGVPDKDQSDFARKYPGVARLIAAGEATWNGKKPQFASFKLPDTGKTLSDMIIEDRG
jgi:prevent-host-death family protein